MGVPWLTGRMSVQVHSSEYPQIWNMTKCLLVALCTAAVGVAGSVALLFLSLPERVNWFQYFQTPIDHGLPTTAHSTNGQVRQTRQCTWLPIYCVFMAAGNCCIGPVDS